MGGLRRKMPVTFWTMLAAGGALAALPPLAGFWSKDEILAAAFVNGHLLLWTVGIITAILTAFYVTRALWMTFYGEPRDHHLYDHAHESPQVMALPLVALGVGSAVLGLAIGFPPEQGFIHHFLGPVLEHEGGEHAPELVTVLALSAASVVAGLIGIAIGVSMYVRHRPDPAALTRAAGPIYRILVNKYYIDELYDHRFVEAGRAFAGAAWAFDIHIIDGLANRLDGRLRWRPGSAARADRHRRQLRAHDRGGSPPGARRVRRVCRGDHRPMTNVLSLLIVIPLAGLVPLFLFRRDERAAKQVAITTTFVELVVSLWMLTQFRPGEAGFQLVEQLEWLPSLGISYLVGVDGISVLLVPMTTLLTFISVLYSSGGAIKTRLVEFMTAFLLLESAWSRLRRARPLPLYIFFELMLVPCI